jgi:RNase adapter protein RapZ
VSKSRPIRILLVTGMSGAGKSTALKTLEDLGWEAVDNLPFSLLDRLLGTPTPEGSDQERPLAIGIDSRTRGFDARTIVERIKDIQDKHKQNISTLFLDCSGAELERRYSETRRRHPLAKDRPASDGIARERELIAPLRRWAEHVIDTTASTTNDLKTETRSRFGKADEGGTTLTVMSFGFSRGIPRNADLVLDMRYLRNPYWDVNLRPLTGQDAEVSAYIKADVAYDETINQIEKLILTLIPRYTAEGKAYVTIAFGCTGGQHRSVHVAEYCVARLKQAGYAPTLTHRDITARPTEAAKDDVDDEVTREFGRKTKV